MPNIVASGLIGANGAPWELDDGGRVVVGPGRIIWNHGSASPWMDYRELVTTIDFAKGMEIIQTRSLFNDLPNLTAIYGLAHFDMSNVTDINSMFRSTPSLIDIGDISNWDTSNITNMPSVFFQASALSALDLSGWNVHNVLSMSSMFSGTTNLDTLDISRWRWLPPDSANISNLFNNSGLNVVYVGAGASPIEAWILDTPRWDRIPPREIVKIYIVIDKSKEGFSMDDHGKKTIREIARVSGISDNGEIENPSVSMDDHGKKTIREIARVSGSSGGE